MALMCGGGIIPDTIILVLPSGRIVKRGDAGYYGILNAYLNNPDGPIKRYGSKL